MKFHRYLKESEAKLVPIWASWDLEIRLTWPAAGLQQQLRSGSPHWLPCRVTSEVLPFTYLNPLKHLNPLIHVGLWLLRSAKRMTGCPQLRSHCRLLRCAGGYMCTGESGASGEGADIWAAVSLLSLLWLSPWRLRERLRSSQSL